MGVSTIPAGGGGGLAPKYQKFTSSGTFTLPDGYGAAKPLLVTIQVIGGGGGGGAAFTAGTGNVTANWNNYFGANRNVAWSSANAYMPSNGGGSGGLCATQLYLTSNLTITCGAAGARASGASTTVNTLSGTVALGNFYSQNPVGYGSIATLTGSAGGTGGTTTASVLQATGGAGGTGATSVGLDQDGNFSFSGQSHGGGGTPAGTTGMATPLLGTLAGGSSSATPVRGSFGVGGISTDLTTSTGAEGTGGGVNSIAAPGAVILTWWQ